MNAPGLAARIDAQLPQTQCTRCGYPSCADYAQAIAGGEAAINRCPPGGAEGIARLSAVTGQEPMALDPACGAEGPLELAVIDEAWCIGCTRCIDACPVDCIVGAAGRMHAVIEAQCTGCALCVPACPVDCIAMVPAAWPHDTPAPTGRAAWPDEQATSARSRYAARNARRERRRATSATSATSTTSISGASGLQPADAPLMDSLP